MYQIFEQLMKNSDFQLAERTRSRKKLSVLSIGNAFKKIACGIAREAGLSPRSRQSFRAGHRRYNWEARTILVNNFIISYKFPLLFHQLEGLTNIALGVEIKSAR